MLSRIKIIEKIKNNEYSKTKVFLYIFITVLIFLAMHLYSLPIIRGYSKGLDILDNKYFGYNQNYVKTLFYNLNNSGRQAYLYHEIFLDTFLPIFLGFSLLFFTICLYKKSSKILFTFLIWLVFGYVMFDYIENILVVFMLLRYPSNNKILINISSLSAILKILFSGLSILAIIIGSMKVAYNEFKTKFFK